MGGTGGHWGAPKGLARPCRWPQRPPRLCPRRQDDVIGKVSLSRRQISAEPRGEWGARRGAGGGGVGGQWDPSWHHGAPTPSPSAGVDGWLSLAPVDPDEEVQGEIHLELQVPEQGHPRVLRCHLIEARWGGGWGGWHSHPQGLIFGWWGLGGGIKGGDGDSSGTGLILPSRHQEGASLCPAWGHP